MLKKIALRVFVLLLIISMLELLYYFTYYRSDLEEKAPELFAIRNTADTADIYYFGESSNDTYSPEDTLLNSISQFTARFFPSLKIVNINKNASHAGIYKGWLRELSRHGKLPAAVIVTMNLRSFNAQWINSDLETQLREGLVFGYPFTPLINRFLLSLQAFDNATSEQRERRVQRIWAKEELRFPYRARHRTVKEWDASMANGTYLKADGSWDQEKIVLACHYIKAYAFNLDSCNPRVRDFDAIACWSVENHVPVYFNLLAENIAFADSLVGKDLLFLMRENHHFLVNRYQKANCKVVDNFDAVPGHEFIDQDWTTEHYKFRSRMKIAKNLADTLRSQFKNQYSEAY